jgi:hypothetical protein
VRLRYVSLRRRRRFLAARRSPRDLWAVNHFRLRLMRTAQENQRARVGEPGVGEVKIPSCEKKLSPQHQISLLVMAHV